MRKLFQSDTAENSVLQTIAIAVSVLLCGTTGTFLSNAMFAGMAIGDTNRIISESTITANYLNRELGGIAEIIEATPKHVTVITSELECISYSIELDDEFKTTLVRVSGGCDDSDPALKRMVLLNDLREDSDFQFINIAGLPIIDGSTEGKCRTWFTTSECDSSIPAIIKLSAATHSPLGTRELNVSVPTKVASLEQLDGGSDEITITTTLPGDMLPVQN